MHPTIPDGHSRGWDSDAIADCCCEPAPATANDPDGWEGDVRCGVTKNVESLMMPLTGSFQHHEVEAVLQVRAMLLSQRVLLLRQILDLVVWCHRLQLILRLNWRVAERRTSPWTEDPWLKWAYDLRRWRVRFITNFIFTSKR